MSRARFNTSLFIVAHYSDTPKDADEVPVNVSSCPHPASTKIKAKYTPKPEKNLKSGLNGILSTSNSETSTRTSTPVPFPAGTPPTSTTPKQVKWLNSGSLYTKSPVSRFVEDPGTDYFTDANSDSNSKPSTAEASPPAQPGHTVTRHWEEHIPLHEEDLPPSPLENKRWRPPCACPASSASKSLSCKHGYRRSHSRSLPPESEFDHEGVGLLEERRMSIEQLETSLEKYEQEPRKPRTRIPLRRTQSEFLLPFIPPLLEEEKEDYDEEKEKDVLRMKRLRDGHKLIKAMKARITGPERFRRRLLGASRRRLSISDGI